MEGREAIGNTALNALVGRKHSLRALSVVAACALFAASVAHAQLLDGVDIHPKGNDAEIVVHFATPVQYVRHAPLAAGKTLRVYLQLTGGAGIQPGDLLPATLRPPKNDWVPKFTVTFPESGNALTIEFDRHTRFSVQPGADGRSISVLVPSSSSGG
jgi:hypothetical protein